MNTDNMKLKKGHAIAFDFDGVIHKYSKGWQDGSIYDEPNDKAISLINILQIIGYPCLIISTRDPKQIKEWWDKNTNIESRVLEDDTVFFNDKMCVGITNRKLPAQLYIDDRAYKYEGQTVSDFISEFSNETEESGNIEENVLYKVEDLPNETDESKNIEESILYKYEDKKLLKRMSKGELANLVIKLINMVPNNENKYETIKNFNN